MIPADNDRAFAGSIPELYERFLVPLVFEPYASDLASRVARFGASDVLEIAAGTGVVTRALAKALPGGTAILATDLNPAMLDLAAGMSTHRPVAWRQADAMKLPFADEAFDCVVCQFGVMFFPDKAGAFAEARRVLRQGGKFIFNVWDRIDHNDFANTVTQALADRFPDDPPRFLSRTPHGYHDREIIFRDLRSGGFMDEIDFSTVSEQSRADSAAVPALAMCQGTPLRTEIENRGGVSILEESTAIAAAGIERKFGAGPVTGRIQAHVVCVQK